MIFEDRNSEGQKIYSQSTYKKMRNSVFKKTFLKNHLNYKTCNQIEPRAIYDQTC